MPQVTGSDATLCLHSYTFSRETYYIVDLGHILHPGRLHHLQLECSNKSVKKLFSVKRLLQNSMASGHFRNMTKQVDRMVMYIVLSFICRKVGLMVLCETFCWWTKYSTRSAHPQDICWFLIKVSSYII